jgi:hypothetical protein
LHLKISIGIWVLSRKEDQILRLDLNPYWVILNYSRFHGGCGIQVFQVRDSLGVSARDSHARWQRCFAAFACELSSWIGSIGFLSFISFSWVFILRDLLPIPMELAPPMQVLYTLFSFWTVWSCIYIIIILFILWLIYFIHLAFRTHVSSCVHDGIKHP